MVKEEKKNVKINYSLWLGLTKEKLNKNLNSVSDVIELIWKEFKK